ncbi:MAG: ATP-binding cassette domain-containing protein [Spirochaetes bacterium]|nr:ATP-binding cassette domain-containing protein [Spirochaetota bacterium]
MITVNDVSLLFGKQVLFKEVNLKFIPGNCYGIIGANGSGKSTLLKIISREIEPSTGEVDIAKGKRTAVLQQDQFAYDEHTVLYTVIMGHKKLYDIMKKRDDLYAKPDFNDEDGMKVAELEAEFGEMNGYSAEADAAILLAGLGIEDDLLQKKMKELETVLKVRVLLAQALFGNPDILLLDEPTNHLDLRSITWLENFLYDFENVVLVVSHDRHFLNKVCTHMVDIDYQKINLYVGNYSFWAEASQLRLQQQKAVNKKKELKAAELKAFIQRFSSNASKARQATSRKKRLEQLNIEELPASSRRFPYIAFKPDRESGERILTIEKVSKSIDGEEVLKDFSLTINKNDKVAFIGPNNIAKTALFNIITEVSKPDSGSFEWGETILYSYFPKNNAEFFDNDLNLIDWLRQYSEEKSENYIRGFHGRMLFSGEETLKQVKVLSGGEKVRCMLSRMMVTGSNFLILDEPTNHLDLESISALNTGLVNFPGMILFNSHDHQFVHTVADRIIEFTPDGMIDRYMTFDEYMLDENVSKLRDELYHDNKKHIISI